MEISNVILRVSDLERATAFWSEKVGLDVKQAIPGFAFLAAGPVTLALSHHPDGIYDESLTEVVLQTADVAATHAAMVERGVPFEAELRVVTENEAAQLLAAHFRDPDGHYGSISGWVPKL